VTYLDEDGVSSIDPIAAEAFARECERLAAPARALHQGPNPHATTPAKAAARMTRWVKPKPGDAKG
jgi:hypothetical protein